MNALASSLNFARAQNPPRVLFQAFWWDYKNNNYPNGWYNYLTELAPRLKGYGIDGVWIPPSSKGGSGTSDDGYGIFDHYDLGDKFQKGDVRTRLGTKDEYLRMVAVMHANGIDVIQDIVLNHVNGAGPQGASDMDDKGGKDPNAPDNQWKNFRYTSFSTPATNDSKQDYLNRNGRWPKDYQNFHKSNNNAFGHNDYNYPQHSEMFGPDICYNVNAINSNGKISTAADYGLNTIFNPMQPGDYMKQQALEWGVWLKKQTGFDGVRLDATKHVDWDSNSPQWDVVESFLYNLQHGSALFGAVNKDPKNDWANGNDNMFAVSEFVPKDPGYAVSMEAFIDGIKNRSGTFDFNLRDGIYDMISGNNSDISNIPGTQISQGSYRDRTVSFINNHDTFRPKLDASGNYVGWDAGNELRPHVDPFTKYLPAAYAIISAVDGSPQVFFEDLFNIGGTGKRFTHAPTDPAALPAREKIANIIWARKALNFAGGAYKVRSAEAGAQYDGGSDKTDLLVIERSGKAVIAVNDHSIDSKGCWIDTDFAVGDDIKDFSGNTNFTYHIPGPDTRIHVTVPPPSIDAQGNAIGGYVIIGKYDPANPNIPALPPQPQRSTTQEWEMADDLGDSHVNSLGQSGQLPAYNPQTKTAGMRYVGKIYAEGGKDILIQAFPEKHFCANIQIWNEDGTDWAVSGGSNNKDCSSAPELGNPAGEIDIKYTFQKTGWIYIYAQNISGKSQKMWVKATYTAPTTVVTSTDKPPTDQPLDVKSLSNVNASDLLYLNSYPNPSSSQVAIQYSIAQNSHVEITIYSMMGEKVAVVEDSFLKEGNYEKKLDASRFPRGIYFCKMKTDLGEKSVMIQFGD